MVGQGLKSLLLAVAILVATSTAAVAQTFPFDGLNQESGTEQSYTVPAGMTVIDVSMSGGDGGQAGGDGGTASAVFTFTPGQVLYVEVGGAGATGQDGRGGWNGGADGGYTFEWNGAGGGGASDIRTVSCGSPCTASTASLNSRLLVAGGGGGGGTGTVTGMQVFGGSSADPDNKPTAVGTAQGGDAGLAVPGTAGLGCNGSDNGSDGVLGVGGVGGGDTIDGSQTSGGGGGGGGYWGGGGGGACLNPPDDYPYAGGGGGGSNYASAQASDVVMGLDGTAGANGSVSITPAAPGLVSNPTIAGTDAVGQTLSVVPGLYANTPSSYAYQWYRCDVNGINCTPIAGAIRPNWVLTSDDLGTTLKVQETASNAYNTAAPALSSQTPVIGEVPSATAPPSISGDPVQGDVLSEGHGLWSYSPTSYAYQWERCGAVADCTAIAGATNATYQLASADVGSTIRVLETATNSSGSGSPAASALTQTIQVVQSPQVPGVTALPSISGGTVAGDVLSEVHGIWSYSPTSYTYQWERCVVAVADCTGIAGATNATYRLASADVGSTIRVQETATNAYGSGSPTASAPTQTIQPTPQPGTAAILGDTTPAVGVSETYAASVVDTAAAPTSFAWTVDGTPAGSSDTLSYVFTTAGRHVVVLQVTDQAGNRISATLTVTATLRRLGINLTWTDNYTTTGTTFVSLQAPAVPVGTHIALHCDGRGCPFTQRTLTVTPPASCHATHPGKHKHCPTGTTPTQNENLSALVQGHHLRTGAKLTVTFTLQYFVGEVQTFTIGHAGAHRLSACLAPGATKPGIGC